MKSFYTKEINDWVLNIAYTYVPAIPYSDIGSTVEVETAHLENKESNNTLQVFEISDFCMSFVPMKCMN